ncbi:fimbrial biogenesis chaperone [Morganella morganii]|uniref:fimbrial biogenesis chaperone n=1 Tax=Morganella morganii TaxID=582 RepID=UPI001162DC1D|nr:molecular chaperone [Morganella morganii]QQO73841.1 molecular chaperone [Morganella morganii]
MKHSLLSRSFPLVAAFIMLSLVPAVQAAEGGLRLAQTRVIFNADNKNANAVIKNNGQQVYLIKADVMNTPEGNNTALPAAPFIVTPPMFRLEKESRSTALIARNGTSQLPADRESVFWLSFLAIPAVSKSGDMPDNMTSAQVSVGIRNVIKLFYRPAGLTPSFERAQEKLTFRRDGHRVSVNNPTPYYLTLSALSFNGRDVNLQDHNPMIAPFSSVVFPAEGTVSQAQWAVITDYGDMGQIHTATVSAGE